MTTPQEVAARWREEAQEWFARSEASGNPVDRAYRLGVSTAMLSCADELAPEDDDAPAPEATA